MNPLRDEFGPFSRRIAQRFFTAIPLPEQVEPSLREAFDKGEVVHVMHTTSVLGFFYLAWFLLSRRLPRLRAAIGLGFSIWRPFRKLFRKGACGDRLNQALDGGHSALVFLNTSSGLIPAKPTPQTDPFFSLIERARRSTTDRPILLVPELFLWSARASSLRPGLQEFVLGSPEDPRQLVSALGFLLNYKNAFFRVGDRFDLTAFVAANAADSDEVLVRKVRGQLSQDLVRETRAIVGPPTKPRERLIEETLRDRVLRAAIEDAAVEKNRSPESQTKTARRYLREIAARPVLLILQLVVATLDLVFRRIFVSVEVDEPGFESALESARRAPVVYCPSHKSHLDYLLMGWLLVKRGLMPPLVAAGANLSFWPLGVLLRRCGAYFVRRTFKDNRLYATVFRTYVKKLLREGHSQEFFIEGGRSRTGKLLRPKLGMVDFIVTGFFEGAQDDVSFVPVALDYEKVLELKSYTKELSGGEKRPESVRSLLTAPKALASRYGRIYISFGEPFSLREFLLRELGDLERPSVEARHAATRKLAERITAGIDRASTVTPAALLAAALLSHERPGQSASRDLDEIVRLFMRWIARSQGRLSCVLDAAPTDVKERGPLREVLRMWQSDRLVRARIEGDEAFFEVPDRQRLGLCFYKNNLLHALVQPAMVASLLLDEQPTARPDERRGSTGQMSVADLRERHAALSRLLHLEFSHPNDVSLEEALARTLDGLAAEGLITWAEPDGDDPRGARVAPTELGARLLPRFAALIADLLESYLLVATHLSLAHAPITAKDLLKKILDEGRIQLARDASALLPESLSKPTLASAIDYFTESGFLEKARDGRCLVLSERCRKDDTARQALVAQIAQFLRARRARSTDLSLH
jgi:glycerol-3-phosphate O-acyltransferase